MSNVTTSLLICLSVNLLFFLAQTAMADVASENDLGQPVTLLNCQGTLFAKADKNACANVSDLNVDTEGALDQLPSSTTSISPTTGNVFTDVWSTVKSWIASVPGVSYFAAFISAIPNFLKSLGLPQAFVFGIGALWYLLNLWLLIAFMGGRND